MRRPGCVTWTRPAGDRHSITPSARCWTDHDVSCLRWWWRVQRWARLSNAVRPSCCQSMVWSTSQRAARRLQPGNRQVPSRTSSQRFRSAGGWYVVRSTSSTVPDTGWVRIRVNEGAVAAIRRDGVGIDRTVPVEDAWLLGRADGREHRHRHVHGRPDARHDIGEVGTGGQGAVKQQVACRVGSHWSARRRWRPASPEAEPSHGPVTQHERPDRVGL